jgi:hypothetical protein
VKSLWILSGQIAEAVEKTLNNYLTNLLRCLKEAKAEYAKLQ